MIEMNDVDLQYEAEGFTLSMPWAQGADLDKISLRRRGRLA